MPTLRLTPHCGRPESLHHFPTKGPRVFILHWAPQTMWQVLPSALSWLGPMLSLYQRGHRGHGGGVRLLGWEGSDVQGPGCKGCAFPQPQCGGSPSPLSPSPGPQPGDSPDSVAAFSPAPCPRSSSLEESPCLLATLESRRGGGVGGERAPVLPTPTWARSRAPRFQQPWSLDASLRKGSRSREKSPSGLHRGPSRSGVPYRLSLPAPGAAPEDLSAEEHQLPG